MLAEKSPWGTTNIHLHSDAMRRDTLPPESGVTLATDSPLTVIVD